MKYDFLNKRIQFNRENGFNRELYSKEGVDFISNDYLGLAGDDDFQKILKENINQYKNKISGSRSSRLLAGHTPLVKSVEEILADFTDSEDTIIFPSGYQANISLLSSLVRENDLILSDEYNHASLIDGIRLSKGSKIIFKHNNLSDVENILKKNSLHYENIFIVCESVYSMEGNLAPLKELSLIASKYNTHLIVDESHSTGLYGENGSGLINELKLRDRVFCSIHTGGKALGVSGAWVSGPRVLKDYLTNFSRGFIYSTAPSPLTLIALKTSVEYLVKHPYRKSIMQEKSIQFRKTLKLSLKEFDVEILGDSSPIIPIILHDNRKVANVTKSLEEIGINVAGIRYPTVPREKARLRISLNYLNSEVELDHLIKNLKTTLQREASHE